MVEAKSMLAEVEVGSAIGRYGTLLFPADDAILGPSLRNYGEWAQREIELLLELAPAGATLIDVGAFVGTHSLAFAHHAGGTCHVHAFEPNPASFELLARNLALNEIGNVEAHCVALSDRPGELRVARESGAGGNFGHAALVEADGDGDTIVEATTLDEMGLAYCDLLKIDVEGMEAAVLAGARATLSRCRPVVYTECNALAQGWPVVTLMRDLGFACWGHCFAAFNPRNFRRNEANLFGPARELGLLFMPSERCEAFLLLLQDHDRLAPIETIDDLALCLLRKPQYKGEVLARTAAAETLGTTFLGDDTTSADAAALRVHLARVQLALDEAQALAWGRAAELERLGRQLDTTQAALESAQRDLTAARIEEGLLRSALSAASDGDASRSSRRVAPGDDRTEAPRCVDAAQRTAAEFAGDTGRAPDIPVATRREPHALRSEAAAQSGSALTPPSTTLRALARRLLVGARHLSGQE